MSKLIKILSIDGGGMRGIIPAMVLAEIERRTGKHCSQLFDLMAGTSAGSVIVMGVTMADANNKPKISAADMVNLIEVGGKTIFSRSWWHRVSSIDGLRSSKYPPEGMKETFVKYFGNARLKDALTEVLVPAYELETGNPFFFKRRDARKDEIKDFSARDIVAASSSAPVYFEPYVIKPSQNPLIKHYAFIDGGVVANNPTMCAYVEAKDLYPEANEYLILSLGTGDDSVRLLYEMFDRWGAVQWVMPLFNIFLSGSGDMVDHQMKTLLNTTGDKLNHYYRLQPKLHDGEMDLDKVDDIGIHMLKTLSENLVQENHKLIDEICGKLLKN